MPARTRAPLGAPCWVDLQTSDVERARSFYPEVLGWEALPGSPEFGGYFMFARNGIPVAGGTPSDAQAPVSDIWSIYLATQDAAGTTQAAMSASGQVVVHPMPVADLGTMGFLLDSGGAGIGLWQPDAFPGFGLIGEAGAPSWFELYARDHAGALDFYRRVFGWSQTRVLSDSDEFRYTVLLDPDGTGELAGVMDGSTFLPEGVPSHWVVYFGVDDTDAAVRTVQRLGGSVLEPPADSPYGRVAHVADPMGARFKLVGMTSA